MTETAARAQPADEAPSRRPRTIVAAVLGVAAVLVLTVTIVAAWAEATVLRSGPVADLVSDALADPAVQSALADYVTDQVVAAVDLEAVVAAVVPDSLDRVATAISSGVEAGLRRRLTAALADPDVQEVLDAAVERAHGAAMQLLRGDGLRDGVTVEDGRVTLNLLPLIARGLQALQSIGLLDDVEVPTLTRDGDPTAQRAQLSGALARDLPPTFGELVVYEGVAVADAAQSVQTARRLLALAERGLWLLAGATVVLVAATLVAAVHRWRAALLLGAGTAAAMVVLRAAVRQVAADAPDLVVRPGARAATTAILDGASASLLRVLGVVLLLALVTVTVGLVRGRWNRTDVVLVAAVATGGAVLAVVGPGLVSLVVGVAAGIAVPPLARRLAPPPAATTP